MAENKWALTPEMKAQIEKECQKFPAHQRQSAALMAIRIVQDLGDNSVTTAQLDAIAEFLNMPAVAIYEVATFYTMCKREPVGKHIIGVCTNISCMLNGADKIAEHFKEKLKVGFGETTADKAFTLEEVECLGACVNAPMCQIGKKYYEHLTPERVDQILNELTGK